MYKKNKILALTAIIFAAFFITSCVATDVKINIAPTQENFQAPVVSLDYVDVAHYWGWWYFSKKVKPTMGTQGDYGAPLDLAFIFNIENPNPYPVKMDSIKFTIGFEDFDLNTVENKEIQWIPAEKTNQVRVHAMFDGRQSLLSLLVTGGFKLKEKGLGTGAGAALKQLGQWWETIPGFEFPIHVKQGAAVFSTEEGIIKVTAFEKTFP
ncbi:MAG: hypothetical protein JRJ44_00930 [Deltaproteobacteria bacterium]|nr:hypothetical protein [Deltaproteobacteria bacterium]